MNNEATEEQKWRRYVYAWLSMYHIRWCDDKLVDKLNTELSSPERTLFIGLIRPFNSLKQSGHTEQDSLIAKVKIINEIMKKLRIDNILHYEKIVTDLPESLKESDLINDYKHSCHLFGIGANTSTKPKEWDRKQLGAAITAMFRRAGVDFETITGKQVNRQRQYTYRLRKESVERMMEMAKMHVRSFKEERWENSILETCREKMQDYDMEHGYYVKYTLPRKEDEESDNEMQALHRMRI